MRWWKYTLCPNRYYRWLLTKHVIEGDNFQNKKTIASVHSDTNDYQIKCGFVQHMKT